jgi:hypothetical protein
VLTALVGGIAAFAAFVAIEARAGEPLIPREVLAVHNIRIGNILTVFMGVVITTPLFFLSLYLQQVLGESALRTGMSLLPMACVLIPLIGPRRLALAGGLIAAAGPSPGADRRGEVLGLGRGLRSGISISDPWRRDRERVDPRRRRSAFWYTWTHE